MLLIVLLRVYYYNWRVFDLNVWRLGIVELRRVYLVVSGYLLLVVRVIGTNLGQIDFVYGNNLL